MATKPSDPSTTIPWGDDTTLTVGSQIGQTVKDSSAGLSYIKQGCAPGRKARGRVLNYFFNELYKFAQYLYDGDLEGDHSIDGELETLGRLKASDVVWARQGVRSEGPFTYCDSSGNNTTPSMTIMVPLTSGMRTGTQHWAAAAGSSHQIQMSSPSTAQGIVWEVRLPSGAVVTQVRAIVGQDAVDGGGNQMTLKAYSVLHDKAVPTSGRTVTHLGTDEADGSADDVLTVNCSPTMTANDSTTLKIEITCSGSGASLNAVLGLDVTFSDPGPRNF